MAEKTNKKIKPQKPATNTKEERKSLSHFFSDKNIKTDIVSVVW